MEQRVCATVLVIVACSAVLAAEGNAGAGSGQTEGSCMVRWLRTFSPSMTLGQARRKARVFLRVSPPLDEANAATQDLDLLEYFFDSRSNAEMFVKCVTVGSDERPLRCARNPPCRNGGQCVQQNVGGVKVYGCQCPPNTAGQFCETVLTACGGQPCQHNSTCVDHGSSYSCQCHPFYDGRNCENQWLKPDEYRSMKAAVQRLSAQEGNSQSPSVHLSQTLNAQTGRLDTFLAGLERRVVQLVNTRASAMQQIARGMERRLNAKITQLARRIPLAPPRPSLPRFDRIPIRPILRSVQQQAEDQLGGLCVRRGQQRAMTSSGTYSLSIGPRRHTAFCNMSVDNGGWIVIQRRRDATVAFHNRTWNEFKEGFGSVTGNFWFGNEKLYQLTNTNNGRVFELRVDLIPRSGQPFHIKYSRFAVGSEEVKFRLQSVAGRTASEGVSATTFRLLGNLDFRVLEGCGGWWHTSCFATFNGNLNARYSRTAPRPPQRSAWLNLNLFSGAPANTMPFIYTEMKIRPIAVQT